MKILNREIDNAIILFALKEKEDAELLVPAEEHIRWLKEKIERVEVVDGKDYNAMSDMVQEVLTKSQSMDRPLLIEIITHGGVDCERMGNDKDQMLWDDVVTILQQVDQSQNIILNAMSTCLSFPLVESLSPQIPIIFASNITAHASTFNHIKGLYEKGPWPLTLMEEKLQYLWYMDQEYVNKITSKWRYELLNRRHSGSQVWEGWDKILRPKLLD